MIVVDTNIIVHFILKGDLTVTSKQVYQKDPDWLAPVLWKSEFRNVLGLYVRKEIITLSEALNLMEDAVDLMFASEYDVPSRRVLELASRSRCTAYDCEFVAVAEEMAIPLVTWDRQVLKAFPTIALSPTEFLNGRWSAS